MRAWVWVILLAIVAVPVAMAKVEIIPPEILNRDLAKVSVLDARELSAFQKGHVPGSQPFDWQEWTESRPGFWSMLFGKTSEWGKVTSEAATLSSRLEKLGLSTEKRIVVVGQPQGWGEEGRVAWDLLYWGAADVALLDGGFPAWESMQLPIEKGDPKSVIPGKFTVKIDPERRATKEDMKQVLADKSRPLVDSRSKEEFQGKAMAGQRRGGRIPGATLIPALELYRRDGSFLSADMLAALVPKATGAPVAYCTGGVRSALFAVLYEAHFGKKAANYDGSMWEWSADSELPIEKN